MHTSIGVFSSRSGAEAAYKELVERQVPPQEIVFLTCSLSPETAAGKERAATVGGAMGVATGMTAGVGAAMLLVVPGIGQVAALGFGAAALLGLAGAGAGCALGKGRGDNGEVEPTPGEKCAEDVEFFRKVLAQGRSLIVVRSESAHKTRVANQILCRLGISMQEHTSMNMQTAHRQFDDVTILEVTGRITVGEGSAQLRELVRQSLDRGHRKILMNLKSVGYIDSSGLGELVKSYTTVRNHGGQLKLVQVSKPVNDLLHMTKLNLVLEVEADEASALQSFGAATLAAKHNLVGMR